MLSVFCNGCFDVLHVGHLRLLAFAKRQGHYLFVGLNSDESVRRLKGKDRPVNNERDRMEVLLHLRSVDGACIFEEDTPENLIRCIRPDVLVKGPDWRGRKIAGEDFVRGIGGRVVIPDWPMEHSTTSVIERIRGE